MAAFWFWVIVAVAFAIAEVMTVAFFAAFIALGALGAAIASLLGFNLLVQAIVLGVIGVAGIFVVRPYLVARVHVGRPALRSGADSMVGQQAVLLEPIRGAGEPGHVKIAGELWPAITEDGSSLPATTPVIVTALRRPSQRRPSEKRWKHVRTADRRRDSRSARRRHHCPNRQRHPAGLSGHREAARGVPFGASARRNLPRAAPRLDGPRRYPGDP